MAHFDIRGERGEKSRDEETSKKGAVRRITKLVPQGIRELVLMVETFSGSRCFEKGTKTKYLQRRLYTATKGRKEAHDAKDGRRRIRQNWE